MNPDATCLIRVADCHPDRPHYAKGLCKTCYYRPSKASPEYRARQRDYANARLADPDFRAKNRAQAAEVARRRRADPAIAEEIRVRERKRMRRKREIDPEYRERTNAARSVRGKRQRQALKLEMIEAYGGGCSCCGEMEPMFLTLEHLNGDGKAHRKTSGGTTTTAIQDLKRRGWPKEDYTVLCFNCNSAKAINSGRCPHELGLEKLLTG